MSAPNITQYLFERHMIQNVLINLRKSKLSQVELSDDKIEDVLKAYQQDLGQPVVYDDMYSQYSNMSSKWHPAPENKDNEASFFTEKLKENIKWIEKKANSENLNQLISQMINKTNNIYNNPAELRKWLDITKSSVGITGISGFVKTSDKNVQNRLLEIEEVVDLDGDHNQNLKERHVVLNLN